MADRWIEQQRRHFDRQHRTYSTMYGEESAFHAAMTARFLEVVNPREGFRVLELGCGYGRLTIPLLRAGCRVWGLDLSRPTLDGLVHKLDELGVGDHFVPVPYPAEQMEYREHFDLVCGRGFLHHLEEPETVLSSVRQALVPGGCAAFMDPNPHNPGWLPFHAFHPTLRLSVERHLWRGTDRWARRMFDRAGLQDATTRFVGLVPPPFWGRLPGVHGLEDWMGSLPGVRRLALYLIVRGHRPGDGPDG